MRLPHRALAAALVGLILANYVIPVSGCGPFLTQPIFAFKESPDLPFEDFVRGNIGIVRPSLGHKTLVIAYRYLNGGSFTGEEQRDLVDALKGIAPEQGSTEAIKAWVKVRKELFGEEQKLPQIYSERPNGGYDFFPNCTANAFEVATKTFKDRVASYGADNFNVKLWVDAQDTVFENCASGSHIPAAIADGSPTWLRKDRDYQIAAAHFYSLNFDEAHARFEQIANDVDSPWRELATYLIGRTLVRQASLTTDETKKREFYQQVETHLQTLISTGGKFTNASRKLLGLVKYHLRPEERLVELGQLLAGGSDDNLRQDLIDYVWLLDKLQEQMLKAEEERKKKLNPPAEPEKPAEDSFSVSQRERYAKIESGELINLWMAPKTEGSSSETRSFSIDFKWDVSQSEIFTAFERLLTRPLTPDDIKQVKESHAAALATRLWNMSPNRKWDAGAMSQYEGCYYDCDKLTLDLVPESFRATDLSDWIVTLQMPDPAAYDRALSRWRETRSSAWLVAALTKAEKTSPRLAQLLLAAEKIGTDEPSFPTIAYYLVRLNAAIGKQDEARKLLDQVLSEPAGVLPPSTQNLFIEQRRLLAKDLNEFLKSAPRKPVAFYNEAGIGKISELMEKEKRFYDPKYWGGESKEQSDGEVESTYKHLLPWDDRVTFDEKTTDAINWHFSLQLLTGAARNQDLPDYLRRSVLLAAWTRAILLNNDDVALSIAPEVVSVAPEMSAVFEAYLKAPTVKDRGNAALYALLKFPTLSPYVTGSLSDSATTEELDYYLESAWWCALPAAEYDGHGNQVAKIVPAPAFLTAQQLETAHRERLAITGLGDAKSYLGKQVIEWAKSSPLDPRIPEALFIAVKANESYKYGCDGWEFDEQTKIAAETLLRKRYELSPWTAKLGETDEP
jgi:hypothetical protein